MRRWKQILLPIFYVALVLLFSEFIYLVAESTTETQTSHIIINAEEYQDLPKSSIYEQFQHRIEIQPFNLVATIIFICAICHIFLAHQFHMMSDRIRENNREKGLENVDTFAVEFMSLLGEIEIIFGLWVIPLMIAMSMFYDWKTALQYLNNINYTEPLFVIVIMALSSTRPIMQLAETIVHSIARIGNHTVTAWWFSILTFGPLLGSFITEPAAMTISALLLTRQFYKYSPSNKLAYATLGLLFVNISVGGVMTNFAAPPVLMIVNAWGWDTAYMMTHFGLKAITGIILSNSLYYWCFRKEFNKMETNKQEYEEEHRREEELYVPFGVSFIHIFFLAWVVVHLHYPVIFIGTFLLFLGFHQATRPYQSVLVLRTPVLVGFFLAGLIVHGTLQGWWVSSLLIHASSEVLLLMSVILTAFNDNAEVTFLATLIPSFTESMKYAVVAGAITGGGLTVIANAPNLAGQSLLERHFKTGISALYLFYGALIPTIIMVCCFYFSRIV